MHGCTDATSVAESGRSDGQQVASGCPQRRDVGVAVAPSGAQHGGRMAGPSEPAAHEPAPQAMATDVGGIRAAGGGERAHRGAARGALGMAQVGGVQGDPDAAVHPQTQPASSTPISAPGVLALLKRQRYRCALSGRTLTPESAALDHIVPVRLGGQHIIENAQVLDKDVNRAKNALTSVEFIALCREVVGWCGDDGPAASAHPASPEHPPSLRGGVEAPGGVKAGGPGPNPARYATWANVGEPVANGRAP